MIAPVRTPGETVKIMSYNIHFGVGMDDKFNLETMAQSILSIDPDILGLQEAESGRITSLSADMAYWFSKRLGMDYAYLPAVNNAAFGVALLSKYPIHSCNEYILPSLSLQRVMLACNLEINGSPVSVFVTHLGLEDEDTQAQIDFLLNIINTTNNSKILMGDFNLWSNTTEIMRIKESFIDSAQGDETFTFQSTNPYERIDYIFLSQDLEILNYSVLSEQYGSDHLPVFIEISIG